MNEIEQETANIQENAELSEENSQNNIENVMVKPKTAYFQFMDDNKEKVKNLSITERAKTLGQLWKDLPEEQKNMYKQQYNEQMQLYKQYMNNQKIQKRKQEKKIEMPQHYALFIYACKNQFNAQYQKQLANTGEIRSYLERSFNSLNEEQKNQYHFAFQQLPNHMQEQLQQDMKYYIQ